ncbi:nuclear GTPase SLIP-GC-like [Coturnix japonica]|uniref:nuclear GTPase SLIP-GC-like n=1 Tax=Coturnix japonica TaxID=93934 RepID=UPI000776CBF6|nr:nuclear GTPase SLIP-GC-like [Coturnix japonica]XP_015715296.1 nuclear GTPase SLIP-GC-like [Coturnix japonica]
MAEGSSRQFGGSDDLLEEIPKKKCRRDQIPEDGEQESLKNCKRMQSELKAILERSSQKLSQFLPLLSQAGAREGILYLRNRLTSLKPDILMDPIYIGLFGSTGAGKSTLLNAIIDKNFFLPVSGSSACTSCVVQINTSRSKQHEAKIHLLTDEEWRDELRGLVALVDPGEDSEDNNERSEVASKISAIYGRGAETRSYEELCRMRPIVSIPPSRCIIFREATAEELSDKMCPYIRSPTIARGETEEDGEMEEEDRKTRIWPLIKNVEVTLPYSQVIPEGVVFVDIPGTGDFNSKRDEMWKENINKCSVIWVVNSFQRILGEKIHEMLLREGMKAFQSGMCRDISLVATKSDDLNLDEYRWEKKKKNINKHDAILERNEAVKQEKSRMIKKKLKEKLPNDLEVVHKADLVYTVSAREYWNEETLSKEETEIPKLRDYIRKFHVKQKRNVLMDHTMEAITIFSLIESLQANKHAQYQLAKRNHLREIIVQKIADLEKDISKCFLPIEQSLKDGVEEAKKSYKAAIRTILSRSQGYQGYHRTLRAVCLKRGVYASRTFYRIDINSSLAQPIYEKIDMNFGNVFRIQMGTCSTLKTCLDAFKGAVQQKLQEAQIKLMADSEHKLAFLKQETDFIVSEAEKLILQRKANIYQSLVVSIQNDLLLCYEETAAVRGQQAYQKMQTILSNGIMKAVESGMFERAENSMREHLQGMKDQITRKLEEDFSNMLSLAFCPWDQLDGKLPDLQNEFLNIRIIHKTLQSAKMS